MNVGGYPPTPNTSVSQSGPKGLLAFADLTLLGMSTSAVNDLVGWRNYATAQPGGNFGSFAFTPAAATNYYNAVLPSTNEACPSASRYNVLTVAEPTGFAGMLMLNCVEVAALPRGNVGGVDRRSATTAETMLPPIVCWIAF